MAELGRIGRGQPLVELVRVEPALHGGVSQALRRGLAIGVRGAQRGAGRVGSMATERLTDAARRPTRDCPDPTLTSARRKRAEPARGRAPGTACGGALVERVPVRRAVERRARVRVPVARAGARPDVGQARVERVHAAVDARERPGFVRQRGILARRAVAAVRVVEVRGGVRLSSMTFGMSSWSSSSAPSRMPSPSVSASVAASRTPSWSRSSSPTA